MSWLDTDNLPKVMLIHGERYEEAHWCESPCARTEIHTSGGDLCAQSQSQFSSVCILGKAEVCDQEFKSVKSLEAKWV